MAKTALNLSNPQSAENDEEVAGAARETFGVHTMLGGHNAGDQILNMKLYS